MIRAVIAFLAKHRQLALFAGAILAVFSTGYCAGRHSVAQPAVHEALQEHARADVNSQVDTTTHAGPERITVTDYDVGPWVPSGTSAFPPKKEEAGSEPYTAFCRPITVPGQDRIIRQTVIERGASLTETHAATEAHQEQDRKLDLTLSPAAAIPRVSAFWLPKVSGGFDFGMVGADLRLTDRVSLVAAAQPFAPGGPAFSVGARVGIF